MNEERIVKGILDIGESMLRSGAENFRLEDSMYRMLKSYNFKSYDVFVIPSNIQLTVETQDGRFITQIRHIETMSLNFDRLDYLNNLSRYICQNQPDELELHEKYKEVLARPKPAPWVKYVASIMGGVGFAVFFGCDAVDAVVALIASFLIAWIGGWLGKRESNMIVYNMILSFIAEVVILGCTHLGIGSHPERVMIGIVMLLISGLGVTNGIRDLMQKDILSGTINIISAMLGAAGIAFGTALALLLFQENTNHGFILNEHIPLQLISCTVACTGFALLFKIRGRQILYSSVGAFFTWAIYLLVYHFNGSNFLATLVASIFVAFYAFIMSRINKAPSTIFLTASVFPLIPGPNLYYLMIGCLTRDIRYAVGEAIILLATCLAIAFGFIIIDVVSRSVMRIRKQDYHINKNTLPFSKKSSKH